MTTRWIESRSPIDRRVLGRVAIASRADYENAVGAAERAFGVWRSVPAPQRGELVRQIGLAVRAQESLLAEQIMLEVGKIRTEALGEVREIVDICDFAVGLSRQLYGLTMSSERYRHHMLERWHPLGPVGVITAFNFPMAVFAWNAALALVCGDAVIWKPSEKTPLCALALLRVFEEVARGRPGTPPGLVQLVPGTREVGQWMAADRRLPLISATGSTRMGREVATAVADRLGRTLLELGGNNAMIVAASADPELAVRAITFAAVGTAGQRCTSLRRLYLHSRVRATVLGRVRQVYSTLRVGNPLDPGTHVGPLIDERAYEDMQAALAEARAAGARVSGGERVHVAGAADGVYVRPAIVELEQPTAASLRETFAPLLYVFECDRIEAAIEGNNAVRQGLSSALISRDLAETELFLSAEGSDCGIANVNIGTAGAEIGGAFGGEKDSGGGRESGSDAWKAYMRRQTQTVNWSAELPLAQGVNFDVT